jgi:hypothetical protein
MEKQRLLHHFSFLELSILSTIIYFDFFDYPLTFNELKKYLYWPKSLSGERNGATYADIEDSMGDESPLRQYLTEKYGFWCLRGREEIISLRQERYKIAQRKYAFFRKVFCILGWIPFVRAAFITNTLSYNNTREESDIDLFIVSQSSHLWTVRFFWNSILTILRLRPGQSKGKKEKICANFFVSEQHLDLSDVALKNTRNEVFDVHLAHLFTVIVPIFDEKKVFRNFLSANSWAAAFFPHDHFQLLTEGRRLRLRYGERVVKSVMEWIFSSPSFEERLMDYQLRIMPKELKESALVSENVIVRNDILKFHLNDRRKEILRTFNRRLNDWYIRLDQEHFRDITL